MSQFVKYPADSSSGITITNIDGGAAAAVFLPVQSVNGGSA